MPTYSTVDSIIDDVARECGLGRAPNAFTSNESNIIQMVAYLKSTGRRLLKRYQFLEQTKEHTFVTTTSSTYALPADFARMVNQTGWNRTSRFPLRPTSPQQWQRLKAADAGRVFSIIFRPRAGSFEIWPQPPTEGETIAFEYKSLYWVRAAASASPDKTEPTVGTDVVCIDATLMVAALKYTFKGNKGFDTSAAAEEFKEALEGVLSDNAQSSRVVDLGRGSEDDEPFISGANVQGAVGSSGDILDTGGLF